jgi:hypothetical protein
MEHYTTITGSGPSPDPTEVLVRASDLVLDALEELDKLILSDPGPDPSPEFEAAVSAAASLRRIRQVLRRAVIFAELGPDAQQPRAGAR